MAKDDFWRDDFNLANVYFSTGRWMSGKSNQTLRPWIQKAGAETLFVRLWPYVGPSVDQGLTLISKLLHSTKNSLKWVKCENTAKILAGCEEHCIKAATCMSCWKRAALAVRWSAVCRLSYLLEGSGRRLVRARPHLLPFALVYGACGLCGEKCLMAFLILVFPKRIRQIFYSLAAKMCDLMVQKRMSFNLKGIVFL